MQKDLNTQKLIQRAQDVMKTSHDKIHDFDHVARVVSHTNNLTAHITNNHYREALELAAWWHDAGRTILPTTSLLIMSFLDDTISTFMLWYAAIMTNSFNKNTWLAGRLILCKSLGTGTIFTKFFLSKKTRKLLHILKDADMLDMLRIDRIEKIIPLVNTSPLYYYGYKTIVYCWFTHSRLIMKTKEARTYIEEIIRRLLTWIQQPEIAAWHIETFGKNWSEKMLRRMKKILDEIVLLNLQTAP